MVETHERPSAPRLGDFAKKAVTKTLFIGRLHNQYYFTNKMFSKSVVRMNKGVSVDEKQTKAVQTNMKVGKKKINRKMDFF